MPCRTDGPVSDIHEATTRSKKPFWCRLRSPLQRISFYILTELTRTAFQLLDNSTTHHDYRHHNTYSTTSVAALYHSPLTIIDCTPFVSSQIEMPIDTPGFCVLSMLSCQFLGSRSPAQLHATRTPRSLFWCTRSSGVQHATYSAVQQYVRARGQHATGTDKEASVRTSRKRKSTVSGSHTYSTNIHCLFG